MAYPPRSGLNDGSATVHPAKRDSPIRHVSNRNAGHIEALSTTILLLGVMGGAPKNVASTGI